MEKTPAARQQGAIDMRPATSPYASPLVTLRFGDGPALTIPIQLVHKSPPLTFRCGYDKKPHLEDISGAAGHVFVHYLFTGNYECLKQKGSSQSEKDNAEFKTSAEVYVVAREYDLPGLEVLAKSEMERLSSRVPVMQIIDMLKDVYPNPRKNDLWFQDYLQSLVQPLMDDASVSLGDQPDSFTNTLSFANVLMKAFVELWHAKTGPTGPDPGAVTTSQGGHEKVAVHIETKPVLTPMHGSTSLSDSSSTDEGNETEKAAESVVKQEPTPSTGLVEYIAAEEQMSRRIDKEQADDNNGNINTPVSGRTSPSSESGSNDVSSEDDSDETHAFIRSYLSSATRNEASGIPLATGAEEFLEVTESLSPRSVNRMMHICALEKYANFSPEELRLRHERFVSSKISEWRSRHPEIAHRVSAKPDKLTT